MAPGLDYGTNNQTTTIFTIAFNGTATDGGSCVANFAINEITNVGTKTRNLRRTVTFNAELAPGITFTLLGNATGVSIDVPSGQPLRVNVTATKQDGSNSRDITFPTSVMSSSTPTCTATLDGGITRQSQQYSSVNGLVAAGSSSVTVTYNVSPTNPGAVSNCETFNFNATEGSAIGSAEFSAPISFTFVDNDVDSIDDRIDNCPVANPDQSNIDGDNVGDVCDDDIDGDSTSNTMDVDEDGDGLIELRTAAELNMMRHNLGGTGLDNGTTDNDNNAGGNSNGCGGGMTVSGTTITTCNGYELMADIDLNDLENDLSTPNWQPVGSCPGANVDTCSSSSNAFSGTFDGNNYNVSNMRIVLSDSHGVGFFGHMQSSVLRDLVLSNVSISLNGNFNNFVGGLAGFIADTTIIHSAVELHSINNQDATGDNRFFGGFIGFISGSSHLISVAVIGNEVVGTSRETAVIGGLGGHSREDSTLDSSVSIVRSVTTLAGDFLDIGGGLFGQARSTGISFSATITNAILSGGYTGGMIGEVVSSSETIINASYVLSSTITGVGGLGIGPIFGVINGVQLPDNVFSHITNFVTNGATPNSAGTSLNLEALKSDSFAGSDLSSWENAWCNKLTGEFMETADNSFGPNGVNAWDLGTAAEFPVPACTPFSPAVLRAAITEVRADRNPVVD